MMIGNKADLLEEEKLEEMKDRFEIFGLKCFYTSAKNGKNIEKTFSKMVNEVYEICKKRDLLP